MAERTFLQQVAFDNGYAYYCNGKKIPVWADGNFIAGWWDACDSRERFGEHEHFLHVED